MNWDLLITYLARAIALLTAIPFHEAAHAWAADKLGDPTAKNYGRLSLNPVRHFDPLGALCMILVGFGWAKPVPVAARHYFKHPKRDMALSAAAGPAANLLLAFFCMIFFKLVYYLAPETIGWMVAYTVLSTMVQINIVLAMFNLLPVPPLDGSRIFSLFLPRKYYFAIMRYERYMLLALFVAIWSGVLDTPLSWLINGAWTWLIAITQFIELMIGVL